MKLVSGTDAVTVIGHPGDGSDHHTRSLNHRHQGTDRAAARRRPLCSVFRHHSSRRRRPLHYENVINGQRSSFTNVTLDGINVQDNYIRTGGVDFTPNQLLLDQVQEFTVITSNQGAASGGGASQVNFTTPSGHESVPWRPAVAKPQQRAGRQ